MTVIIVAQKVSMRSGFSLNNNNEINNKSNNNNNITIIGVSNIVLDLIFRSEPLRAQRSTIVRSIPYSKQDVCSAPQSENTFKPFFQPVSPTGSY